MSPVERLPGWLGRLPTAVLAGVVVVAAALLVAAAVLMYRTYSFVEHDNDFCLTCHLMAEPYERFAQSAHRGLGCKACHKPTFAARSQMALTQILEQPDTLATHAEVPNEKCADCHIEGNPEQWRLISQSAGHRVHLESEDPSLQGLMCVECHSSSVHEFAATTRTCGQAGCHSEGETRIRLGAMGGLTIHCVACHEFSRPIEGPIPRDTLAAALQPRREQCLSCHAMRVLVGDMPSDEPHGGACGACHDPHRQEQPAAAVATCAGSGCHAQPDTLTPMHRGLDPGVLEGCTRCHTAHDFRAPRQTECLACHQGILEDDPRPVAGGRPPPGHPPVAPEAHPPAAASPPAPEPAGMLPAAYVGLVQSPAGPGAGSQDTVRFSHARHRVVECGTCHTSERTHGGLTVTGINDCRECHHTTTAVRCTACHSEPEYAGRGYPQRVTFRLSVGRTDPTRTIPFRHEEHGDVACRRCHTGGLQLSAAGVECASCHVEHHEPDASCLACHAEPAVGAHQASAHVTCSGSGCHQELPAPVRGLPRTRSVCLTCHQEQVDHRVGRNCVDCHALPAPTGGDR